MKTLEKITGRLEAMVVAERKLIFDFLVELEELDRRQLYAQLACSSTYAYCTEKLRLTNSSAHRRIRACRLMRRFPVVGEYIRSGRVSLAKLATLEPVLEVDNCVELLDQAESMTEYDVKALVATLSPAATSVAGVRLTPLTRELTEVRLVVGEEWVEWLGYARRALSHEVPNGNVAEVLLKCMKKVVAAHERKRYGAGKPRGTKPVALEADTRPTVAVSRTIAERDGERCTYTAPDGRRCDSRHQLEEHHIVPVAKGGQRTLENITLYCRVHNQLRAREDFGEAHMAQFRRDEDE